VATIYKVLMKESLHAWAGGYKKDRENKGDRINAFKYW